MTILRFDKRGLDALAVDIPKRGTEAEKVVSKILGDGADKLRDTWKRNAKVTSGKHGKRYPDAIEVLRVVSTDLVYDIGPNPSKPQGGMSFENGSVNQPAHNDGKKAADEIIPLIEGRIATAAFHMFGLDS